MFTIKEVTPQTFQLLLLLFNKVLILMVFRNCFSFDLIENNSKLIIFIPKMIKMTNTYNILILLTIFHLTLALSFLKPSVQHFDVDKQLATLRDQQTSFEKQILSLIEDIKGFQAKVNANTNTSQKVIILQNAILSERQKIFQLQNSIIPPFNLSKNACRQLTDDQKIKLIDQLQKAKDQVGKLKAISVKLPSNPQITSINSDIAKQETLLESIQKAIYTKCQTSVVLTPTILQSNLQATNWILGKQTIENIVQQYYQRSRLYHNVTNCDTGSPFFDGAKCIKCDEPLSIFNMQTQKCQKCPFDTKLNSDKHVCEQITHFTDYKSIQNYMLDGATLPTATNGNTPCPTSKPFFNGTCVKCSLPSYWNVKENKCKDCEAGQVFNINTKLCAVPKGDSLTYLQGTSRWVTSADNFTKVLQQRADLLKNKPNQYSYCGKQSPYFDGISCISCPKQYSLAQKKCVSAPNGLTYDSNLHAYIVAQTGKDTNPSAPNIISEAPLPQAKSPCDLQKPFFDGVACIQCPDPFPLFDAANKKCVRCGSFQLYDKATLKCIKRQSIFISNNFNDLMATPKMSFPTYKAELYEKVKNNGDNIIRQCSAEEYSNYTHCFKCQKTQKFNIQTKKCDNCNGTIDSVTLICEPLKTLLTNLDANNLLVPPNSNLSNYIQAQKKVTGPILKCPNQRPYSVGGLKCISCDTTAPYFDLQAQKCVNCAQKLYFNTVTHKCQKEIFITNVASIKKFIEVENYTVVNIKTQLENLSKVRKTALCSNLTPIALAEGDKCIACDQTSFYNLKTKQCVKGVYISNVPVLKALKNVLQTDSNTLAALQVQNNAIIQPKILCQQQKPLWNGQACIDCPQDNYYYLANKGCYVPKKVTNLAIFTANKNYIESGGVTLQQIQDDIKKEKLPVANCPNETPLFDGSKCMGCAVEQFYNLQKKICLNVTVVSNTDAISTANNYIEKDNATLANLALKIKTVPQPKRVCPAETPLYSGAKCIACKQGVYNIESIQCSNCAVDHYFDQKTHSCLKKSDSIPNLNNEQWIVSTDEGLTKVSTLLNQRTALKNSALCPDDKPHFSNNTKNCESCPKEKFWNYQSYTCVSCAPGEQVDKNTRKCGKRIVGEYQTNLNSKNILYDGFPKAQFEEEYNSNKIKYPRIQDCPNDKPYFDGFACIQCRPANPLFSLLTKLCSSCPPNSIYDETIKNCFNGKQAKSASPTMGKMYSSIF